jgi:hypothetical protein
VAEPFAENELRPINVSARIVAVLLTGLAFGLLNSALAYGLARLVGMPPLALPALVLWLVPVVGLLALLGAVVLWRREMRGGRTP